MKLPENFEKEFFTLLIPVVTDGTVKNRRNLLVAAFSVLLLYFLERPLSELSIFGIKLESADGRAVLIAALILVLFWFIMFCIHATKDAQINKERRHLLTKHAASLKERIEFLTERYQKLDDGHPNKRQIKETQQEYDIFLAQQERTKLASRLAVLAFIIEYALPLVLGMWCVYRLGVNIWQVS